MSTPVDHAPAREALAAAIAALRAEKLSSLDEMATAIESSPQRLLVLADRLGESAALASILERPAARRACEDAALVLVQTWIAAREATR